MEANSIIKEEVINELNIKINSKDKEYQLNINRVKSNILFLLKIDSVFPPEIYEEEYNLEKLQKENKLFSLYQKLEEIISFIVFNLKKNNYILEINKEKAIIKINSGVIGIPDINLLIKKKEINQNNLISLLCEEVKTLKEKLNSLENKNFNNNILNDNNNINLNNNKESKISIKIAKQYENYKEKIYGINIFPNGNFIAYSGNNKTGSQLFIFEGKKQKNVYKVTGQHKRAISYLEIIDDNNFITSSFDRKIVTWSIKGIKPKVEQTLKGHSGKVFKVIFINPKIYSSGEFGEIIIWEKKDQKYICAKVLKPFKFTVYNILHLNLNQFISCDKFGNLLCWNLQNFNQESKMKVPDSFWNNGIVKLDDIKILYGGRRYIQIINIKDAKIEKSIKIKTIVFSMELLNNNYFIYGDNVGNIEIREINTLNKIAYKKFKEKPKQDNKDNKNNKDNKKVYVNHELFYAAKKYKENYALICSSKKKIYLLKIQE